MRLDDLTIPPEGFDRDTFLADWAWAMREPMLPVLITAVGDVFAQGDSGAVYFVDVVCGDVEQVAQDMAVFRKRLSDAQFVEAYFQPGRISKLRDAGLLIGPREVYAHTKPLVLGGADELANYETSDAAVHVSMHGQIHAQVKEPARRHGRRERHHPLIAEPARTQSRPANRSSMASWNEGSTGAADATSPSPRTTGSSIPRKTTSRVARGSTAQATWVPCATQTPHFSTTASHASVGDLTSTTTSGAIGTKPRAGTSGKRAFAT